MSYRTAANRNQLPRIRKMGRSEARRRTRRAAFGRAMSRSLRFEPMEARLLLATLVVNGDQDSDPQSDEFELRLNASDASQFDVVQNGATTTYELAAYDDVEINGLNGDDTLIVDQENGLVIIPVTFNGGAGTGDLLVHTGDPGGTLTGEYTPSDSTSGVLEYSSTAGTSTITFTGLEPVQDLVPAATLTVNDSVGSDDLTIEDGPTVNSQGTYQVDFAGAAETLIFRNKVELIVNGQTGNDSITLDVAGPSSADALDQIQINGDGGFDTINVDRFLVGSALLVNGGTENDTITLTPATGGVDSILPAAVTVDGGGDGADSLVIDDTQNTYDDTWTVTGSTAERAAFGGVTYSGLASLELLAQNAVGAVVDVESTSIQTRIDTGGGDDEVNVAAGDLSTIVGDLDIETGVGDDDSVVVWDNSNAAPTTYNITPNAIAGPNPGTITYDGSTKKLKFNAGSGADTLFVDPSLSTAYTIDGAAPTTLPGDEMTVDLAGTGGALLNVTGPGAGTISFYGGHEPIDYTSIESVDAVNGVFDLGISGDGNANEFRIALDAAGTNIQLFLDGDLVFDSPAATTKSLAVLGLGGDDSLTVDGVNGLPVFAGTLSLPVDNPNLPGMPSLLFDGGSEDDELVFENLAGGFNQSYAIGDGTGGGFSEGEILTEVGDDSLQIYFAGLEPVLTTSAGGGTLTVIGDTASNAIQVVPSPLIAGGTRVQEVLGPFESFDFAPGAFTDLQIFGHDSSDLIELIDIGAADDTLSTVTFDGRTPTLGDDDATDFFQVYSNERVFDGFGIPVQLNGGGGDDIFYVYDLFTSNVDRIIGPINVDGNAGDDTLIVNDAGSAGPSEVVDITGTTIEGITGSGGGGGTITYTNLDGGNIVISANDAGHEFNVISTAAGLGETELNTGGGSDTVNVNDGADTANGVISPVDVNAGGGEDTLNIVDTADGASNQFHMDDTTIGGGGFGATVVPGGIFGADGILFYDADLEAIDVDAGDGANEFNIDATGVGGVAPVAHVTIDDGSQSSTFNIQTDLLAAEADHTFNGNDAPDTFNAYVGLGGAPTGASIVINGQADDDDTNSRDVVNVIDEGGARAVSIDYVTATSGDVDVDIDGGTTLDINTVETMTYAGDVENDDDVTVLGTDGDDDLTVAQLAVDSALVFLGGNPWDGPNDPVDFADAIPGLASGTSLGPDILLSGVSQTGLTLDGGGAGTAGDQLYVYAPTEEDLVAPTTTIDPFGYGDGVIIPGFGTDGAYDEIFMSDSLVSTTNVAAGVLVDVNVNTDTFTQTDPKIPGLIVNAGFDPSFSNGLADDIEAVLSYNFALKVNGGDPVPAFAPEGDRLSVIAAGEINVFSNKLDPVEVTITSSNPVTGEPTYGLTWSSIESAILTPGLTSQTVNLVGDNNEPEVDQNDNFVVYGADVDATLISLADLAQNPLYNPTGASVHPDFDVDPDGDNEFFLEINGSTPIGFRNVAYLNAFGDDQNPPPGTPSEGPDDIDTLDIRPYADNTPTGWGIDVRFDEGNPAQTDGEQADLLIYRTSLYGGAVSEDIVIAPSGPEAGEIQVTNGAFGTPIVDISYVNNLDIIVLDDDGFDSDTDTLTMLGTAPDNEGTSGRDLVTADFTNDGSLAEPLVVVEDLENFVDPILYRVRDIQGFDTVTIDTLGGVDIVEVTGRDDGSLAINVDNGDVLEFPGTADDSDIFIVLPGTTDASGSALVRTGTATNLTTVTFDGTSTVQIDGGGGESIDQVTVMGTGDDNAFTLEGTATLAGNVQVDAGPTISFMGLGSDGSLLVLNGEGGDDAFSLEHQTDWQIGAVIVSGGAPSAGSDSVEILGTGGDDEFAYTAASANSGTVELTSGGSTTNYILSDIEQLQIDALGQSSDALDVTTANATVTPGATPGTGVVDPVDVAGAALLSLAYAGVEDVSVSGTTAVVQGTAEDDTINVSGLGVVTVTNNFGFDNSVDLSGFDQIVINALGGDDNITVAGDAPFEGVNVIGGDNGGASDMLTFVSSGGDVTLDLGASTITEAGFGSVLFDGIEKVIVDASGASLAVIGTSVDDIITVTPVGPEAGQIEANRSSVDFRYLGVAGTMSVDGGPGGFDQLVTVANDDDNTIDAVGSAVTIDGATITLAGGLEKLIIQSLDGDDTVTLTDLVVPTEVQAGDGNDIVNGKLANVPLILIGGDGNDNLRGGSLVDLLDGGAGNDVLNGTGGNDMVLGGADADLIRVDAGQQRVEGGTGDDVLLFTSTAGIFTVQPNGHMVTVQGPQSRAAFAGSIEEINIREPSSSPDTQVIVGDLTDTGVTGVGISTGRSDVRTGYIEDFAGEIVIQGRDVSDEIAVADTDLHFVLTPLPTVTTAWGHVAIGDTDGFAKLTINAKGGDDSVTVDPSASLGDTLVVLDGGAGNDVLNADGTLLGGDGDDLLIGGAGDNVMVGGAGDDTFIGMGGTDTVDGGSGGDTILAEGTPASDVISVLETLPSVSMLVEDSNGATTYIAPGGIGAASVERVLVEAGDGDDVINVTPLPNINIVVNAGGPSASDLMIVSVPGDATITQGAESTTGTVESGEGLGDIDYTGLENMSINTAGEGSLLTLRATDDDDTIAIQPAGINAGVAWINDGTVIAFNVQQEIGGFNDVELQGRFGSDSFSVTPIQGIGILVNGGDPTASDTVVINGSVGSDDISYAPTAADGGVVTVGAAEPVLLEEVEHLTISGNGGSDELTVVTPEGTDVISYTPVSATTADIAIVNLLGVVYQAPGGGGEVVLSDISGERVDVLSYQGTAIDDAISVSSASEISLNNAAGEHLLVDAVGVTNLTVNALGGDDVIAIEGTHEFEVINVAGGGPDAGDTLMLSSPISAVDVDLGMSTVIGYGGAVSYSGIALLDVDAEGNGLTVAATVADDNIVVTPLGSGTGTLQSNDANPVVNYSGADSIVVSGGAGRDTLVVNGSALSEDLEVSGAGVESDRGDVLFNLDGIDVEALTVNGMQGADTFNVVTGLIPIFIDGGDPIGMGDLLSITASVSAVFTPGPESDEGGFIIDGNPPVSFDHIEAIEVGEPDNGNELVVTVMGTNGDDDITAQGLDPNTVAVSVNAGPAVVYMGVGTLILQGKNGDDDIVVDVNVPDLDVEIFVDGGLATTASDRLRVTGVDGVADLPVWTPFSQDSGQLDLFGQLPITVLDVEELIYDGEADGDIVTVRSAGRFVHTPGNAVDDGQLRVDSLLALDYVSLGAAGSVIAEGIGDGEVPSTLVAQGTPNSDEMILGFVDTNEAFVSLSTVLGTHVPLFSSAIENYELWSLGGDDTFNVLGSVTATGTVGLVGGEPGVGSDTLNYARDVLGSTDVFIELDSDLDGVPFIQSIQQAGFAKVTYTGIETVNADIEDGDLTVAGTRGEDVITFTPLSEDSGVLVADHIGTTYYIDDVPQGNDLIITGGETGRGGPVGGGYADKVIFNGTNGVDAILVDTPNRTVDLVTTTSWRGIELDAVDTIEVVEVAGNDGNDTVWVVPGAAVGNGLFVNVDGGSPQASDALVITNVGDGLAPLGPEDFVVIGQSRNPDAGNILVYRDEVRLPGIAYENVEVVSPNVASGANLLILGPDNYEQNEYYQTAAYLGSGETLNVENLAIFPNIAEHPGVPADQDYFRVVAETTGMLDFQVYFNIYEGLLPAGGNVNIEVYDASGDLIAGDGAFGNYDTTANARVRIPAVEGQTYFVRVFGAVDQVVNGYDMTIVNHAAPVPYDIELLDLPVDPDYDCTLDPPADNSDTGRSHFDNVTCDAAPRIIVRLDDSILLNDIPGSEGIDTGVDGVIPIPFNDDTDPVTDDTAAGYRVAIYIEGEPQQPGVLPETVIGYADFVDDGVYAFDFHDAFWPDLGEFTLTQLTDGSHFISARVEIVDPSVPAEAGYGDRSDSLEIFVDTDPPSVTEFDVADDDCEFAPDNVTNNTMPSFYGYVDEANTVVRVYLDLNGNQELDDFDRLLGEAVAIPIDGNNQFDEAFFEFTTPINLNDPDLGLGKDGLRVLFATAEDLAGNVTPDEEAAELRIFLDTQGPQITDVYITEFPEYDLFDPKPSEDGPTPLVDAITIEFRDLPARVAPEFLYPALVRQIAEHTGHYHLVGDANGIIPIDVDENGDGIIVQFFTQGGIAMARVTLPFAEPLPDDRYTLVVEDNLIDPACNNLDGESNAEEPQEEPLFPTGDGVPGHDFTARFTVDTRPEIGVWAAGNIWVDTNGNFIFDPDNTDYTNRDIIYQMGFTSDDIFAGNFAYEANDVADGFDKLAAYGKVDNKWRWLVDTDNNGVPNVEQIDYLGINGLPVAGNFDRVDRVDGEWVAFNGDEVGVFTGDTWYFDINHDYQLDASSKLTTHMVGYPVVGDFDGDGYDDLGTWTDDHFQIDLANGSLRGWDGVADHEFRVGFIGVRERPVAADMDQDGFDDLGLWLPDRSGSVPGEQGEWNFLVSDGNSLLDRVRYDPINHDKVIDYTPIPFGPDIYAGFGDEYALPVVGNFDPPVAGGGSGGSEPGGNLHTNLENPYDVNADGIVAPIDALLVINYLNFEGAGPLEGYAETAPYLDVNMDGMAAPIDSLMVINYLNTNGGQGEGEGEAARFADLSVAQPPVATSDLSGDLFSMEGLVVKGDSTSSLLEPTVVTAVAPAQEATVDNYALLIGYLPFDPAELLGDDAQAKIERVIGELDEAGMLDSVLEQLAADVSDRQRVEILDEVFGDWIDE